MFRMLLLTIAARAATACSMIACDGGPEVRPSFEVIVHHEERGLRGASLEIHTDAGVTVFRGVMGAGGAP